MFGGRNHGAVLASGIVVTGVATLVLTGWSLDIAALTFPLSGVAMRPDTALALMCLGGALIADALWRGRPMVRVSLAAACGIAVLLELLERLSPQFGIPPHSLFSVGGPMPLLTAMTLLVGVAGVMCLDTATRAEWTWTECCAAMVSASGLAGMFDFVFAPSASYTGLSPAASVVCLVVATGLLFARPDRGLMHMIRSSSPAGAVARRLLPAALIVPVAVAAVRWLAPAEGAADPVLGLTVLAVGAVAVVAAIVISAVRFLDRLETSRHQAEGRFRAVVEACPSGMVMVNRQGTITLVNREIERLFGYSRDELLGRPVERLIPDRFAQLHPGLRDTYARAPQSRQMGTGRDLFGRRKDGSDVPVEVGLTPITVEHETFVLASVVDISARRKAEDDLKRSNQELEQFAYVASHDLQEPLRMVGSFVQLLAERYRGRLDADADEFIGYAVDGAKRMQRLIEDLLAYSRVGTRGVELAMTDTTAVLNDTLRYLSLALDDTGAVVTADPLPAVNADSTQLFQVFQNLIGNALKFRSSAPPRIHVSAARRDREWVFAIRDNGIGIEAQYFDRIFVIFQRLHSQSAHPGTGLGLAITKRIIERHGGRVWLESVPGEGTTFFFSLPAGEVNHGTQHPDSDSARGGQRR